MPRNCPCGPHESPHFSDDPINAGEHWDFEQHIPEALEQRSQARLRHHRDKFVEHGSLTKQRMRAFFRGAHSTAKCNGESVGVEETLTRSPVAEYLSGARVEFILDLLDIGI